MAVYMAIYDITEIVRALPLDDSLSKPMFVKNSLRKGCKRLKFYIRYQ